ncbi:MAG TPA: flagellar biosynthesis protein FlgE [Desulfovibrio sp.]|nr:flagellar biosynthesis protein FlgE [Desulfovibrio sp.]
MSVTGSMYTGISGLQAQSEAISVVSNNLANSTTTAYKSSSITFEDVFYSTVSTGGSVSQVGNGVTVSAVYTDYSQGSYESTNSATDVALTGNGFFVVEDPVTGDTYYTRDGSFSFDSEGYLVDSSGNRIQGWAMEEGSITGGLTDILLEDSQSPPSATSEVTIIMNLDSDATDNASSSSYTSLYNVYDGTQEPPIDDSAYSYSTTLTIYDENGEAHDLTVYLDYVTTNDDGSIVYEYIICSDADDDERTVNSTDVGETSAAGLLMVGTMTFSTSGKLNSMTAFTLDEDAVASSGSGLLDASNWTLSGFDGSGYVALEANFTGSDENQVIGIDFGLYNTDADSGTGWDDNGITSLADLNATVSPDDLPEFNTIRLESSYTTSYNSSSATYTLTQDGYASGTLSEVYFDDEGVLWASYTNGQSIALYTLALADFANDQGLEAIGSNLYKATAESGQAMIGTAGTGTFGDIASSCLEQSNVDTATELTNLIILQAAYQANSKVITTANTLLQTAISMKS